MESKNIMQQNNVSSGSLTDAEKNALSEMVRQLQNNEFEDITSEKQVLPEKKQYNSKIGIVVNREEMHEITTKQSLKISEDDFGEEIVSEDDYLEEPQISEDDFD